MSKNLKQTVINSIRDASRYDTGNLTAPVVVLWPDPEEQWSSVIAILQEDMPELMVLGEHEPEIRTGPAIWLKCMVARTLSEADWDASLVPVIYLPGISKNDLKKLSQADPAIAPLMEYQYTGTLWTHRNGKEWTVNGFLQNKEEGLGLRIDQDNATRDAGIKALPTMVRDEGIQYPNIVTSNFLFSLLFHDVEKSILEWMCQGDDWLNSLNPDKREVFRNICQTVFDFTPNPKNIRSITLQLGRKDGPWAKVWNYFELAPDRFPEIIGLLEQAKPDDMGSGLFVIPQDTWPQINAEAEEDLRKAMERVAKGAPNEAADIIHQLDDEHGKRRSQVWASMGKANLALALIPLKTLCEKVADAFDATSLDTMTAYYSESGWSVDYAAVQALATAKTEKEKNAVTAVLKTVYTPWLERLACKFQEQVAEHPQTFNDIGLHNEESECILFVDAFRYDIARKWAEKMERKNYRVNLDTRWIPLPSLTPTCKPYVSPVAEQISRQSTPNEFRPRTNDDKDLTFHHFEAALDKAGYSFPRSSSELVRGQKTWMEIGKIDQFGHNEQSGLVHRIEELFGVLEERIEDLFAAGFKSIRIVTDHGWLLVPGGMPAEKLPKDHIETRWGRCAILKDGVPSELLHLPWFWNPSVMIAYAPGISFFKKNNEYGHGGVSLQECLVPYITLESDQVSWQPITMQVSWTGLRCSVTLEGAQAGHKVEIRTRHTDESSRISTSKTLSGDGKVSLFVEDADYESAAAFVVVTDAKGVVLEKQQTVVGE